MSIISRCSQVKVLVGAVVALILLLVPVQYLLARRCNDVPRQYLRDVVNNVNYSVAPSPAVETSEHAGAAPRETPHLLSIHMVVIPFLRYNPATDKALFELREQEYKTALQRNLNHNLVRRVHVLTNNASETWQRFGNLNNISKLVVAEVEITNQTRDPFDYISRNLVGKDVIFANADIYLGSGFHRIDRLDMSKQRILYAITRRVSKDCVEQSISGVDMCLDMKYIGCHDTFLFRLVKSLPEKSFLKKLEFDIVNPGIENALIWLFQQKLKYCVLNPCSILETFHLHCSNLRNKKKDRFRVTTLRKGLAPFTNKMSCS